MSPAELAKANDVRAQKGKGPLKETPGVYYLEYGSGDNKEGWWNWDKFQLQLEDLLDCTECLYPEYQIQVEIDWSSGHAKHLPGALNARSMAVGYGGAAQEQMRDTVLVEGCFNAETHPALLK